MDDLARARPRGGLSRAQVRHAAFSALASFLWLTFAIVHVSASIRAGRVLGLGLGIFDAVMAFLFLVRRPAERVSSDPTHWIVAFVGTFGSLLLRPGGVAFAWADPLGLSIQGVGLLFALASLGALGRSFGIVPADRGIVRTGLYRVVRHPMYASYLTAQMGYLLQSPRMWNVCVMAVTWICQVWRILNEERFLSHDPEYRKLTDRTRWRLIPAIW